MRQANSRSFQFLEPDQIDEAKVVEHLSPRFKGDNGIKGGETWTCAWAPNNSYFAWSCGYSSVHLVPWDNKLQKRQDPIDIEGLAGRKYQEINCFQPVLSLAFGSWASGQENKIKSYLRGRITAPLILATGHSSGKIRLWDCKTGHKIIELLDHRAPVYCLDFMKINDGSLQLVSASQDNSLKLWDLNNDGNMYHTFKVLGVKFFGCCFCPNGKWIAGVGSKKTALLWSFANVKEPPDRLSGHNNDVVSCSFSPDSAILATASYDTKIILWSTDTHTQLKHIGHLHPSPSFIFAGGANDHHVRSVAFSKNAATLGSVCDDGYVRFWNLSGNGDPLSISKIEDTISCSFSNGGGVLAVGCRNGDVYFLSAPVPVAPLQSLCRSAIRKMTGSVKTNELPLPSKLIQYLQYCDVVGV